MANKFQDIYRIPSARLKGWDYGANAAYFVTICTRTHEHYFGDIVNNTMEMNEICCIVNKFWLEIPQHFLFV